MDFVMRWRDNSSNEWVREGQFQNLEDALQYILNEPAHKGEFAVWKDQGMGFKELKVLFVSFNS